MTTLIAEDFFVGDTTNDEALSNHATSSRVEREIPDDPIKQFFESFPNFTHDPNQRPGRQLEELSSTCGWPLHSDARKAAVSDLYVALFRQFDPTYRDGLSVPIKEQKAQEEIVPAKKKKAWGVVVPVKKNKARAAAAQVGEPSTKKSLARVDEPLPQAALFQADESLSQDTLDQTGELLPQETLDRAEESPPQERLDKTGQPYTNDGALEQVEGTGAKEALKEPQVSFHDKNPAPATAANETPQANESKEPSPDTAAAHTEPLKEFFLQYSFPYRPDAPATTQLLRLRQGQGWYQAGAHSWPSVLTKYRYALVRQFNQSYGTDENDLSAWHRILTHVPVERFPETVEECKLLVSRMHINLVDLVDARDQPMKKVAVFSSEEGLGEYTYRTKKFFPRANDLAGGLLRHLLRNIFNPNAGR